MNNFFSRFRAWILSFFRRPFFASPHYRYSFLAAAFVNIIDWIVVVIKIHSQPKPMPLHFNSFYGIEFVGAAYYFLEIPLVGLITFLLNFFLAYKMFRRSAFLGAVMAYAAVLIQLIIFGSIVSIIVLNA